MISRDVFALQCKPRRQIVNGDDVSVQVKSPTIWKVVPSDRNSLSTEDMTWGNSRSPRQPGVLAILIEKIKKRERHVFRMRRQSFSRNRARCDAVPCLPRTCCQIAKDHHSALSDNFFGNFGDGRQDTANPN